MLNNVPFQETDVFLPAWSLNKDADARMPQQRPVMIRIDALDASLRGQIVELDKGHAIVRPDNFFYLCKSLYAEISFCYDETAYTLAGQMTSSDDDQRLRIEFDMVARRDVQRLGHRMSSAWQSNPGLRPRLTEIEVDPSFEIEEDFEPGPAVLPAVKKAAQRVGDGQPPEGVERRQSRRYKTSTPTRITLVGLGEVRDCLMLDLSLGGCKLRFAHACGIETGSRVEVQFLENGLPLRLAATVQVSTDDDVLGLQFVNISARMQARLQSLIHEISERG
jgi:hypothetical protein